ncbi:MAG: pro-sigmaK processing inhibitor BofA family protein [Clostridia bacterium]
MDLGFIVTFVIAVAALFIILKILALPMKIIIKLVINGIIGGVIIWLINLIGAGFGFVLTLNWITALVVGLLGVPGVIILVILHFIF